MKSNRSCVWYLSLYVFLILIIIADVLISPYISAVINRIYNAAGIIIYANILYLAVTCIVVVRTHLLRNVGKQYILINLGLLLTSAVLFIALFIKGFMSIPAIILCGESICDIIYLARKNL